MLAPFSCQCALNVRGGCLKARWKRREKCAKLAKPQLLATFRQEACGIVASISAANWVRNFQSHRMGVRPSWRRNLRFRLLIERPATSANSAKDGVIAGRLTISAMAASSSLHEMLVVNFCLRSIQSSSEDWILQEICQLRNGFEAASVSKKLGNVLNRASSRFRIVPFCISMAKNRPGQHPCFAIQI